MWKTVYLRALPHTEVQKPLCFPTTLSPNEPATDISGPNSFVSAIASYRVLLPIFQSLKWSILRKWCLPISL